MVKRLAPQKRTANLGDRLVTSASPIWRPPGTTSIPVSTDHTPCGYWFDKAAVEVDSYLGIFAVGDTGFSGISRYNFSINDFDQYKGTPVACFKLTRLVNGDIYTTAVASAGLIYKYLRGTGAAIAQTPVPTGSGSWSCICNTPNGDVYAGTFGGSPDKLWYLAAGSSVWVDVSFGLSTYHSLCSDYNGNVYASGLNGNIFRKDYGSKSWVDTGLGYNNPYSIHFAANGYLYFSTSSQATVGYTNRIFRTIVGSGVVTECLPYLGQTWDDLGSDSLGNVYAASHNLSSIYMQAGGQGLFTSMNNAYGTYPSGLGGML